MENTVGKSNVKNPDGKTIDASMFFASYVGILYINGRNIYSLLLPRQRILFTSKSRSLKKFRKRLCDRTTFRRPSESSLRSFPLEPGQPDADAVQRKFVDLIVASTPRDRLTTWYYTPMALRFSDHLACDVCVYDCMDELSAFKNAPPELVEMERELLTRADVVFTGGQSLYEAKRSLHRAIFPFPSSIDFTHFHQARGPGDDPVDQQQIPHPRVGYFGVIDERLDVDLVARTAA